jgi:hypothetical protein
MYFLGSKMHWNLCGIAAVGVHCAFLMKVAGLPNLGNANI